MSDWDEFRNTHLQLHWLFPLVIGDRQFDAVLQDRPRDLQDKALRALEKALWFWPRVVDAKVWATGEPGRQQTPLNYTALDGYGVRLVEAVEAVCPRRDAQILDVGCNCGRHLTYLAGKGYQRLVGVDAMKSALELFKQRSPEIAGRVELHHDLFQRFLMRQPDGRFDVSYSHGATIELVHPSFDVVGHLTRITRGHVCLLLQETNGFRREWLKLFKQHGFETVSSEVVHERDGLRLLVLRRAA